MAQVCKFAILLVLSAGHISAGTVDSGVFAEPNETGPIPAEVFLQFSRLAFLGKINGKNFYIERTFMKWRDADRACKQMGMELAEFGTQSELNFVQAATTPADNGAWCGGLNERSRSIFKYEDGDVPPAFEVEFQTQLGLVVSRRNPSACLSTRPASLNSELNNYVGYAFCFIQSNLRE